MPSVVSLPYSHPPHKTGKINKNRNTNKLFFFLTADSAVCLVHTGKAPYATGSTHPSPEVNTHLLGWAAEYPADIRVQNTALVTVLAKTLHYEQTNGKNAHRSGNALSNTLHNSKTTKPV